MSGAQLREAMDMLHEARLSSIHAKTENVRLRGALEHIAIVCTDNMDRSCDHRMALDFVRQIANETFDLVGSPGLGGET